MIGIVEVFQSIGNMKLYKEVAFLIIVGVGLTLLSVLYFVTKDTSTTPTVDLKVPQMIEQTTEIPKELTTHE